MVQKVIQMCRNTTKLHMCAYITFICTKIDSSPNIYITRCVDFWLTSWQTKKLKFILADVSEENLVHSVVFVHLMSFFAGFCTFDVLGIMFNYMTSLAILLHACLGERAGTHYEAVNKSDQWFAWETILQLPDTTWLYYYIWCEHQVGLVSISNLQ